MMLCAHDVQYNYRDIHSCQFIPFRDYRGSSQGCVIITLVWVTRHTSNILLDSSSTGKVVHTDLGIAFEQVAFPRFLPQL